MARASFSQSFRIFEEMPVDCRHGVEAKQFQAQGAKVNALHRPVMHSRGAEGAAVAAAIVQDAPCVAELIAIFPDRVEDIFVGVGMLLIEAVGNEADVFLAGGAVSARVPRHDEILRAAKMGSTGAPIPCIPVLLHGQAGGRFGFSTRILRSVATTKHPAHWLTFSL